MCNTGRHCVVVTMFVKRIIIELVSSFGCEHGL